MAEYFTFSIVRDGASLSGAHLTTEDELDQLAYEKWKENSQPELPPVAVQVHRGDTDTFGGECLYAISETGEWIDRRKDSVKTGKFAV